MIARGTIAVLVIAGCGRIHFQLLGDAGEPPSGVISIAGSDTAANVDGPGLQARFTNPVNLEFGPGGLLYVVDYGNDSLKAIDADFNVTTVVPGVDYYPFGIAGNDSVLYLQTDADASNVLDSPIYRVELGTASLTQLAIGFGNSRGLAILADGTIVCSDNGQNVLRRLDPATGGATVLAGSLNNHGWQDGVGAGAQFYTPYDLVVMSDQTIVVADRNNHRLRRVALDGTVTTIAGDGTNGSIDGIGLAASFSEPQSLALDAAGNVYIGDQGSKTIRRLSPDGRVVTVAGMPYMPGHTDALDPLAAQFYNLEGITVRGRYLYVADGTGGAPTVPSDWIRRVDLASVVP
jgi:hypothetical protein